MRNKKPDDYLVFSLNLRSIINNDQQLKEILGVEPSGKTSEEKLGILREHREAEYERLRDAAYKRKGWTRDGIPTIEHLKKIGMGLPEVIEVVKRHL